MVCLSDITNKLYLQSLYGSKKCKKNISLFPFFDYCLVSPKSIDNRVVKNHNNNSVPCYP